ncbi:unnamed protein product, partial [marine sediment metagenome]
MGIVKKLTTQDMIAIINSAIKKEVKAAGKEVVSAEAQSREFEKLIKQGSAIGVTITSEGKKTTIDPITKTFNVSDSITLTPAVSS